MLYFFSGTDRDKTRSALRQAQGKRPAVRISDANTLADLRSALQGAGMFGLSDREEKRVVVLDGVCANEEMRAHILSILPALKKSEEDIFMMEGKLDADTRKKIEKYAETFERFDAAAKKQDGSVFGIANALAARDKRALWLSYQKELAKGTAPEAIHGVLFWGAKNIFLKSGLGEAHTRAERLIATLVELPHESRRKGEGLEYALERFVLSGL